MYFLRRFLAAKFDSEEFRNVQNLDEVIKMTYTFIDYEKEKAAKEGRAEGEFNTIYNFIKKGRLTLEEAASDIGISVEQLLANFKKYNLVL